MAFELDFDDINEEEDHPDIGFDFGDRAVQLDTTHNEEVSKGPKIPIQQLTVARYVEQVFWETGQIPTQEKCIEDLSPLFQKGLDDGNGNTVLNASVAHSVVATFKNPNVKQLLSQKGIDLYPKISGKVLTAEQLILANMLLNLHDKRSVREKLKEIGVTSQQYHAWLRQPQYMEYLRKRGESMLASSDHIAYKNLIGAVESKDLNAIKFFFELRGIYNPKLTIDVNVNMVLTQVVEVIARHVKDPVALSNIADELDNIVETTGNRKQIGA